VSILLFGKLPCEGGHCELADDKRSIPIQPSSPGVCAHPGYVRRLPSVQYVRDGVVVRNLSLEAFRETGGYALSGLRRSDVNNNHQRAGLQFNFWRPVTIASMRLVHTRVSFVNPLESRGNYSPTSNNMKLVHWPLMGGLFHLAPARLGHSSLYQM